ncbi:hypothetical protein SB861_36600 [Paraburkholderia sp. SIMBA_049]
MLSRYAHLVSLDVLGSVFPTASGGCGTDESLAVGPLYFSERASALKKRGPRRSDWDRLGAADFMVGCERRDGGGQRHSGKLRNPARHVVNAGGEPLVRLVNAGLSDAASSATSTAKDRPSSFMSPISPMIREAFPPECQRGIGRWEPAMDEQVEGQQGKHNRKPCMKHLAPLML